MTSSPYLPPKKTLAEKFEREAKRLGRQIASIFQPSWGHVARLRYDMRRKTAVRTTEGRQLLLGELSILLIFQPKGLLESTVWQIDWLAEQGISTLLVSNAPLSADDRARLQEKAYLVVERPNVGYDFGGYREGVMQMLERDLHPRALYIMNDSMWFPLSADSDAIERGRAAPEDVWGLFVDLDWRQRVIGDLQGTHVQSYFFRFSERVLQDRRFGDYWRAMSLINSKRIVIKMRELKLARYFADLGYSVGGLHNWKEVADFLLELQDEEMMAAILRHQCLVNPKDAAEIEPLLARGDLTALQIRDVLRDRIARTEIFVFSTALHPFVMKEIGFPFLKKQRIAAMVGKRKALIDLGMHDAYPEPIRREVQSWDAF